MSVATRRVVQITATSAEDAAVVIYALCNDGTLWAIVNDRNPQWSQLPPIPQPGDDEDVPGGCG